MSLRSFIQTLCQCHECGFSWKLKYSTVKRIIIAKRNNELLLENHIHGDVASKSYLCKTCPECSVNVCVYSDDVNDYAHYVTKRTLKSKVKCLIEGHDFKGNLRHSVYTCKKCNAKVVYKNAQIKFLN